MSDPGDALRWRVGAVTVTRLREITLTIPYDPVHPFLPEATPAALAAHPELRPHHVTAAGALRLSSHALLVDAPGLRLVVDTCVGNDRAREFICAEPLRTDFLDRMRTLGWAPESVEAVLCTHLHVDHVGWNTRLVDGVFTPTFPNARYCFARAEFEHFMSAPAGEAAVVAADSIAPIIKAGLAHLVEPTHRFTPEISLLPTPGHTIGHVSVLIESDGERAVITGDAIHHPCQMAHPDWLTPWEFDRAQALATRRALLDDLADRGTRLIGTHFPAPTAGWVTRAGDVYAFVGDGDHLDAYEA